MEQKNATHDAEAYAEKPESHSRCAGAWFLVEKGVDGIGETDENGHDHAYKSIHGRGLCVGRRDTAFEDKKVCEHDGNDVKKRMQIDQGFCQSAESDQNRSRYKHPE